MIRKIFSLAHEIFHSTIKHTSNKDSKLNTILAGTLKGSLSSSRERNAFENDSWWEYVGYCKISE